MGAPQRLVNHARLVGEAAELLLTELQQLGVSHDADFVRVVVVLHDSGKILHPEERDGGANNRRWPHGCNRPTGHPNYGFLKLL